MSRKHHNWVATDKSLGPAIVSVTRQEEASGDMIFVIFRYKKVPPPSSLFPSPSLSFPHELS